MAPGAPTNLGSSPGHQEVGAPAPAPAKYIDKIHVSQFSLGSFVRVRTDNGRILIVWGQWGDFLTKYEGNILSQDWKKRIFSLAVKLSFRNWWVSKLYLNKLFFSFLKILSKICRINNCLYIFFFHFSSKLQCSFVLNNISISGKE